MADWELVACLIALRDEFNRLNPNRDKRSDGSIGDRAHRLTSSDHNPDESGATPFEDADFVDEVHAIDVDSTGPWPRPFRQIIEDIRLNHRYGRDDRLQNIIYDGKVCSRSWGWTWRDYTGSNPHNEHAHFSARYTTAQERDTSPWGVVPPAPSTEEDEMDFAEYMASVARAVDPDVAESPEDRNNRRNLVKVVKYLTAEVRTAINESQPQEPDAG